MAAPGRHARLFVLALVPWMVLPACAQAQPRSRARDLGLVIGRFPTGPLNAITDVAGVRVGHVTLVRPMLPAVPGRGPVRTGVTAIIPRDDVWHRKVPAGGAVLNGCGELTGLAWVLESGFLEVPVLYTNTHSVGRVMDGVVSWMQRRVPAIGLDEDVVTPVVGECDDSALNDIRGLHVRANHVHQALESARSGPVEEGAVGAGSGMVAFGLKSGVGTASRRVPAGKATCTLGVLVVANMGQLQQLRVAGFPAGLELEKRLAVRERKREGSIQMLIATDAPIDARQLTRIARRAGLGLARLGHQQNTGSGDFALAFSTAHAIPADAKEHRPEFAVLSDLDLDPLFEAVCDCVEESVLNSLCRAQAVSNREGELVPALPLADVARWVRAVQPR